jgi:hypothetical protein
MFSQLPHCPPDRGGTDGGNVAVGKGGATVGRDDVGVGSGGATVGQGVSGSVGFGVGVDVGGGRCVGFPGSGEGSVDGRLGGSDAFWKHHGAPLCLDGTQQHPIAVHSFSLKRTQSIRNGSATTHSGSTIRCL